MASHVSSDTVHIITNNKQKENGERGSEGAVPSTSATESSEKRPLLWILTSGPDHSPHLNSLMRNPDYELSAN